MKRQDSSRLCVRWLLGASRRTNHIHGHLQLLLIRAHAPVSLELEQVQRTDGARGPETGAILGAYVIYRDSRTHSKFR